MGFLDFLKKNKPDGMPAAPTRPAGVTPFGTFDPALRADPPAPSGAKSPDIKPFNPKEFETKPFDAFDSHPFEKPADAPKPIAPVVDVKPAEPKPAGNIDWSKDDAVAAPAAQPAPVWTAPAQAPPPVPTPPPAWAAPAQPAAQPAWSAPPVNNQLYQPQQFGEKKQSAMEIPDFTDEDMAALDAMMAPHRPLPPLPELLTQPFGMAEPKPEKKPEPLPEVKPEPKPEPKPESKPLPPVDFGPKPMWTNDAKLDPKPTAGPDFDLFPERKNPFFDKPATVRLVSEQSVVEAPANAVGLPSDEVRVLGEDVSISRLEPAKFISSDSYLMVIGEAKSIRRTLRQGDEVIKDAMLRHEQLDLQYKRIAADINAVQESFIGIDMVLFEN